jgi:hypothetical protein
MVQKWYTITIVTLQDGSCNVFIFAADLILACENGFLNL